MCVCSGKEWIRSWAVRTVIRGPVSSTQRRRFLWWDGKFKANDQITWKSTWTKTAPLTNTRAHATISNICDRESVACPLTHKQIPYTLNRDAKQRDRERSKCAHTKKRPYISWEPELQRTRQRRTVQNRDQIEIVDRVREKTIKPHRSLDTQIRMHKYLHRS